MVLGAALEPELKFTHQSDKARPQRGLVQNAGRGGIAGRDRTQVQNAGVRDPFHGLSALPKIHGTGSGPAGLHGIRGTRDDATSGKLAGRGTKDMGLL